MRSYTITMAAGMTAVVLSAAMPPIDTNPNPRVAASSNLSNYSGLAMLTISLAKYDTGAWDETQVCESKASSHSNARRIALHI
eukprot:SAG11_NODE_2635_length_3149_cov_2.532787_1_plen_83_part_00